MSEKKAFVFDTNFIIQYQQLSEVTKNLEKDYNVYVSQVSIDERIAQQCRDLKKEFENVERIKTKCTLFASVKIKKTYEESCDYYKKAIQEKYKSLFHDRIIPFENDGTVFRAVIDRANQKLPPFYDAKDASDKGFKDCLLWLSIIDYFKSNGENEVVFVTDDKSAFRNRSGFLCEEFKDLTKKTIEFKPNSFYREYIASQDISSEKTINANIPENLDLIREDIDNAIRKLCIVESEDYYGDIQCDHTFKTSVKIDKDYVKTAFEKLRETINQHIFEKKYTCFNIV
ncbi:MAG: DUF4935 domain-containing protein [Clostridia bacterium]|nr:DUF4935 domain-containing protein [Clostridia bacterium]